MPGFEPVWSPEEQMFVTPPSPRVRPRPKIQQPNADVQRLEGLKQQMLQREQVQQPAAPGAQPAGNPILDEIYGASRRAPAGAFVIGDVGEGHSLFNHQELPDTIVKSLQQRAQGEKQQIMGLQREQLMKMTPAAQAWFTQQVVQERERRKAEAEKALAAEAQQRMQKGK